MTIEWVLGALIFVALFTGAEGVLLLLRGDPVARKRTVQSRLHRHASRISDALDPDGAGGILLPERDSGRTFIAAIARRFARRRDVELLLYRAGMPFSLSQLLLLTVSLSVGGCAFGFLVLDSALAGTVLTASGALPWIYTVVRKNRRMARFEQQLPEALDLICRALRAGISLEFGFRSVGDEMEEPIATEFSQVADEVSLGLDSRAALQNLSHRMNTGDMPFFINAILIQRETGGNLAEVLDNLAGIIRARHKFQGKVRTLVAQASLTANLLAGIPVGIGAGLALLNPGYMEPLFEPPGIYFLYSTCIAVPTGWLICRRIGSVNV